LHIQDQTLAKVWFRTSHLQLEVRVVSKVGLQRAMVMAQDLVATVPLPFIGGRRNVPERRS
ncbi:MAG: hypothetical protein ACKPKO_45640, partial [Candidatus Fonsibacter sp.]